MEWFACIFMFLWAIAFLKAILTDVPADAEYRRQIAKKRDR